MRNYGFREIFGLVAFFAIIILLLFTNFKIDKLTCDKKLNVCTQYRENYFGQKTIIETTRPYDIKDINYNMVTRQERCGKYRHCDVTYCLINLTDKQNNSTSIYKGRNVQEHSFKLKVLNLKKQFINSQNEFTVDLKKL